MKKSEMKKIGLLTLFTVLALYTALFADVPMTTANITDALITVFVGYCPSEGECAYSYNYTEFNTMSTDSLMDIYTNINYAGIPSGTDGFSHTTYISYEDGGWKHSLVYNEGTPEFQFRYIDGFVQLWLNLGNYKVEGPDTLLTALEGVDSLFLHIDYERSKAVTDSYTVHKSFGSNDISSDIYWFINLISAVGVPEKETKLPVNFVLEQNTPNPFNASTVINYALPKDSKVTLEITNVLGQRVRLLVNERQTAGYKTVKWDGKDKNGNEVASGVYFYQLKAGDYNAKKRMILLK